MNCLGVPVRYDPDLESVSISLDRSRWWWPWRFSKFPGLLETRGIFKRKTIVIGRAFFAFPKAEQQAMLVHEVGHAKLNHIERRLMRLWQIVFLPFAFQRLCVNQEFQADHFAAECGYAAALASALARTTPHDRACLHPVVSDRIARLLAWHSKA